MTRERVRYIDMGPWPYHLGFVTDEQAFNREMRRLKIKNPPKHVNAGASATTHFLTRSGHSSTAIISMPKPSRSHSKEQYAALLAHEAVHVVQDMRAKLGDLGSEAEAYIVQQIVQECLQWAWQTGRTRRVVPAA